MQRRKLHIEFPFFFSYTAFQVLSVAILFGVFHLYGSRYFYAYWTSSALSVMLGFAVIHEVFCYAIRPYVGLRDLGNLLFRWATLLLVLIGGMIAISASVMDSKQLISAIVDVERAVRLMQCGLLLFILCARHISAYLEELCFWNCSRFRHFAATDLVMFSLRSQLGQSWNVTLSLITTSAYNFSVLTWFAYASMPERAASASTMRSSIAHYLTAGIRQQWHWLLPRMRPCLQSADMPTSQRSSALWKP